MITPDDVRRITLFADLSPETWQEIAEDAADIRLRAGDWVAREGEQAALYGVLSGRMAITKTVGKTERTLTERGVGAYYGDVPVLLGAPFLASGRALTPMRLLRLPASTLLAIVAAHPEIRARLNDAFIERVRGVEELTISPHDKVAVIGTRADLACHNLRDFLARNFVEYLWYDPSRQRDHAAIPPAVLDAAEYPALLLPDGTVLRCPPPRQVAEAVGLATCPAREEYDVVVIGGGPTGMAAAVYGASEGLQTLLIESYAPGGQAGTSSRIENYLGFPIGVSGDELSNRALGQAQRLGAEIIVTRAVTGITPGSPYHTITIDDGTEVRTRAIILATGVSYRTLDVPGVRDLEGAGIYYGAARTEAQAMRGCRIYLIGGGNSAGQAAMFFANYAAQVTLLVRGPDLAASMSQYLIDQLATRANITVCTSCEMVAASGDVHLEAITIHHRDTDRDEQVPADGVFIFIGADAHTEWVPEAVACDQWGYVLTGRDIPAGRWPADAGRPSFLLETSVPGIFAAGDVRHGSVKRVAAGVGEGSMAIAFVHQALGGSH